MTVVGVDPGKKGAIAALTGPRSATFKMPLAGKEIDLPMLTDLLANADLVVIEKVHAMPGQGVTSMFTFGQGYGAILGICAALGKRVELVAPQAWKAKILAGTDKSKDAAKAYVQRAYPAQFKRTEGECEALCIAEYGRRFLAMEGAA